jgi:hypothetical protein
MQNNPYYGPDNGGFYRPCFMKDSNGNYVVCYSTINSGGVRGLSLSFTTKANDVKSLRGIDASAIPFMAAPTKKARWARVGTSFFDTTLNKWIICTQEGTSAVDSVWKDMNGNVV